jgi:hypothetical protein
MSLLQRMMFGLLVGIHIALRAGLIAAANLRTTDGFFNVLAALSGTAVVFGQVILLGLWLSRLTASWITRAMGVYFVAGLLWLTVVAALHDFYETYFLAFALAVGTFFCCRFFESIRRWWPWQIEHLLGGSESGNPRQVQLRELLLAISFLGILLGLFRALVPEGREVLPPPTVLNLVASVVAVLFALLINLGVVFPCLAKAMAALETRTTESYVMAGLLFPLGYALGLSLLELLVIVLLNPRGDPRELPKGLLILFGSQAAQFVTVSGSIVYLARLGFVRVR